MTQEQAQTTLKERFWKFKRGLADANPEYHTTFDAIVSKSNSAGLLWEVLELADLHLRVDIDHKGGESCLNATDYLDALMYGYTVGLLDLKK